MSLLIFVHTLLRQMLQLRIQRTVIFAGNIGDFAQKFLREADTGLNAVSGHSITPLYQFANILPKCPLTIYNLCVIVLLSIEQKRGSKMKEAVLHVEEFLYAFYEKVGQQAGGIPAEKVMEDALFKLAGELSLQAMERAKK